MELLKGTASYKTTLDSLAARRGVLKSGLCRMRQLDCALGFPSRTFRTIHVAGTNGKGSVSTKMAHALSSLGYKTGLYTSPHISSFRERIQIDGKWIPPERMQEVLETLLTLSAEISFFETMTMAAFLYFMQEKIDYAVIETGMGGLFDATNIIHPQLTIITSLGLDHQEVLGETLEEIAVSKAGIIKYRTPVVLAESAAIPPVFHRAFEMQAPLYLMPKIEDWMEENRRIAKQGLSILCPNVEEFSLDIMPPCRFELVPLQEITLLFDVAHNVDGIKKLFWRVERIFPHRKVFLIFGMSRNKDITTIASFLRGRVEDVYIYANNHYRLLRAEEMKPYFPEAEENFTRFMERAKEQSAIVVITGSFFIMKDIKERFGFILPVDPLFLSG